MFCSYSVPIWPSVLALLLVFGLIPTANASWQSRVLLIGVDGGGAIPRHNQPFVDLTDALAERLKGSTYVIYTENNDKPFKKKNRNPRNLRQTISAVEKLPDNRLDFAVLLTAKREVGRRADHTQFSLKVIARLIDPLDGRVLETIKVKSQTLHIPKKRCGPPCMRNATYEANDTIAPFLALRLTEEIEEREDDMRADYDDGDDFYEYDEVDDLDLRRDLNG
ncbi:hypothetical protein V5T82_14615 [Magnetovibrio sp. PR-2]|uniref:hypothetical protein n=1 Tax=Magnetovibrio sp. PR-2 TaxID=3120356 RepID=UPI002FCE16CF